MFTGIVTDIGEVIAVEPKAEGLRRLTVACSYPRDSIAIGASIAHSGVCLTVVETGAAGNRTAIAVDAAAETLRLTTAQDWSKGTRLNLERALKIGDELGGHIVSGHVDGVAELVSREDLPDMAKLALRAPKQLMRFIATKGSVALDGVSLTVNDVRDAEDGTTHFSVNIIPHTAQQTTLGGLAKGQQLNVEIDVLARYLDRMLAARAH